MTMTDWAQRAQGAAIVGGILGGTLTDKPQVNDGDDQTGNAVTDGYQYLPLFKVTLTQARPIMAVGLHQGANNNYYATQFRIDYSTNDSSWTTVWTGYPSSNDYETEIVPTTARYWRIVGLAGVGTWFYVRTIHLWEDSYVNPQPPEGATLAELQQKVATQYAQLATTWALLQGAPTNCDPVLMLACIGLWNNWLLNQIVENGTGGGECLYVEPDPNNQAIWDKVDNVDSDLQSGISAIAANDNANMATILANDNGNTAGLISHINDQTALILAAIADVQATLDNQVVPAFSTITTQFWNLTQHVTSEHTDTRNAVYNQLFDPTTGVVRQVNDNTNAVELSINGNVDAAESAILAAIADVQSDTDDIQNTLSTLPSNPAALRLWPGLAGVTFGAPVVLSAPGQISAACHGVTVTIDSYPPGQSRQPAGSTIRHKGIAWLAFVNDAGDYEAIEQIHHSEQVIITKQLEIAAGLAVYCKPGCTLTITPFTIDGL